MALIKCPNCGAMVSDTTETCIHCGAPLNEKKCPNCGQMVPIDLKTCPSCGASLEEPAAAPAEAEKTEPKPAKKSKKKIIILIVIVVIAAAIGVAAYLAYDNYQKTVVIPERKYNEALQDIEDHNFDAGIEILTSLGDYKDAKAKIEEAKKQKRLVDDVALMRKAYSTASSLTDNINISSDGMTITIDSVDGNDFAGFGAAMWVGQDLGFPETLTTEMNTTFALMGQQEERHDDFVVKWTYHPDNGLDAVYSIDIQ